MPSSPTPQVVTLHVWRLPPGRVTWALARVGRDYLPLRRSPGLEFVKQLGTTRSGMFGPRDADLRRWAVLACWRDEDAASAFDDSAVAGRWRDAAEETWQVRMRPLASRGRWARREPFRVPASTPDGGPVVALTRARLAWRRATRFWGQIPAVAADLRDQPGLRASFGVGETPAVWQGTVSVWERDAALRAFAYRTPAHAAAMRRSRDERWYAEELFARFSVLSCAGTLDGRDPLA